MWGRDGECDGGDLCLDDTIRGEEEEEEGAVTVKTTQEEVKLADVKFLVSFVLSRC